MLIALIVQSWKATLIITSSLFFIWSLVNYYVVMFHGSPLFFSELVNIRTAAEVAGGYHFPFTVPVVAIIAFFVFNLILTIFYIPRKEDITLLKRIIIRGGVFLLSAIILFLLSRPVIKKDESWMPWQTSIIRIGFMMCVIEDIQIHKETVKMPEGYSTEFLDSFSFTKEEKSATNTPDIILILNETFYDLEKHTEIDADRAYMGALYSISGTSIGYAVVPNIGGGTNNSETELLSSKSMMMLLSAPFTYLSPTQLSRSCVNYLNDLGYSTYGMHCGSAYNYSRNTGYPASGFQHVLLGGEPFTLGHNGKRPWLDGDNYQDLISLYEEAEDSPRFMYFLTFQNHGGYEQNEAGLDTVHTYNNYGDLTDDVNEYLSSIQLSCVAFKELTDYFATVDRDVIICMVGDHSPPFASNLPAKSVNEIDSEAINLRCVPYVIWSNFDVEFSSMYTDYASMVDLVPMVLHAGGIPLSAYYQYIFDLHEVLPIRTSYGAYVDRDMNIGLYDPSDRYYDQMKLYYYLEYNSLLEGEEYREELFAVPNN